MTTAAAVQPQASALPADVHEFWLANYHQPFIRTALLYRKQFPHRRAAVDLPIFLYSITPVSGEVVQ